ncbi:hypothetical protein ILUMI_08882, partial [Ignelater luminosus]
MSETIIKRKLLKVLSELTEVTSALNRFGLKRHYWRDVLYQVFYVIIVPVTYTVLYVVTNISSGGAFSTSIPFLVFDIYIYFTVSLLNNHFVLLLLVIKTNFSAINNYLENFGKPFVDKTHALKVDTPKYHSVSEIKLMMFLYDKLCGSASIVSFMYGGVFLLSTAINLGDLFVCLFYVEKKGTAISMLMIVSLLLIRAIRLFEEFRVYYTAQVTANEGHATKRLVHKAILKTQNKLLIKE